jgi:hypothetical protein
MTTIWDETIRQGQRSSWQNANERGHDRALTLLKQGELTVADVDRISLDLYPDTEYLRSAFAAGMHAGRAANL